MRKKNLKIQVAALAVTGAIATTPFVARAEETSSTAVIDTEATATTTASEAGTTTAAPASTATTVESTAATTAAPASTATAVESTAATTGTTTTAPAASGVATTAAASTTAVAPASTAAATAATPITVSEPAADPATTVPNKVNNVVNKDDFQGTKINADGVSFEITPDDVKDKTELSVKSSEFNGTEYANKESGDLVMKGDLSIKEQGTGNFDSTEIAAHDVESGKPYSLKADLDVSAVTNAILASEEVGDKIAGKDNAKATYVNDLETGLRATFTMGDKLDGSFYLPTDLEDAKQHYALSASDGKRMIFRINYANSTFAKDKVSIAMDLDLSNITPFKTTYENGKNGPDLYSTTIIKGKDGKNYTVSTVENFRHTFKRGFFNPAKDNAGEYAGTYPDDSKKNADGTYKNKVTYNTSTFGNLRKIVSESAQKIQLIMTGVQFNSAKGNKQSASESTETATEVTTTTTTTTEGTINGTLVGYMKASLGARGWGDAAYKWGAIQNDAGRDKVAGQDNDKVYLTVKFTDKERTVTPITPVNPENPVTPSNGGNGGNGGSRTPIVNPSTPSTPSQPGNVLGEDRPTPSNQGEVLGENRPAPTAVETVEKKGEVLGESRPSGKNVSGRAAVATGDNNFTALWASLFGLSVASLAGFVVLRKKEQEA